MICTTREPMAIALPNQPPWVLQRLPVRDVPIEAAEALPTDLGSGINWGKVVWGTVAIGVLGCVVYKTLDADTPTRHCSICDSSTHDRRNCPFDGPRVSFSKAIPMSAACECCGSRQSRHRHHTRGRSDDSDFLDLCNRCHLHCGHKGRFRNLPVKQRYCTLTGRAASWRTV